MSIMKFLQQYFGIDPSKTRFLTHEDLSKYNTGIKLITEFDENFEYKLVTGEIIEVIDAKHQSQYYEINRELLLSNDDINIDHEDFDFLIDDIISLDDLDLQNMDKYELLLLRKKLKKDARRICGCYDEYLYLIKQELSCRNKQKNKKKKGNYNYD